LNETKDGDVNVDHVIVDDVTNNNREPVKLSLLRIERSERFDFNRSETGLKTINYGMKILKAFRMVNYVLMLKLNINMVLKII
jgi:hypothetical protein